jgi:hypothetical protein
MLAGAAHLLLAVWVGHAAPLPEEVLVPTPTEAIGLGQLWAVRDGKLWVKPTRPGAPAGWRPYKDTGLPPDTKRPVVAIFADEDEHLTVATDDGLLHHHENGAWHSLWGLPSLPEDPWAGRAPLALPVPLKTLRAGQVAYSMRHRNVLYYEDIRGQQFHWGDVGCTSLFVLDERDDTRILFADPWIPPDFSREVCGPRITDGEGATSSVRLAAIAASASTLFVVARDGALFTRFDDYDHNGGTPLLPYSYAETAPQALPGTDPSSSIQIRALPGEDWRPVVPIAREGRGRISRHIAVLQTGVGNRARELRVVGDDASGRRGLYRKELEAPAWRFEPRDIAVADDDWIDPRAPALAPVPALSFQGFVRGKERAGARARRFGDVSARTDDFWFHCSPFTLTLTVGQREVKILVHAVDGWTLFRGENPADDPFAPKPLKATLQLAPGEAEALDARTRRRLVELFGDALGLEGPGRTFAFAMMASQRELVLAPTGYPLTAARSRWELVLRAEPAAHARTLAHLTPASRLAARHVDLARLDDADACRAALGAVQDARAALEGRATLAATLETAMPAGTSIVDAFTIATTIRFTWGITRWLDAFEQHVPAMLSAQALAWSRTAAAARADFDDVEGRLSRCARGGSAQGSPPR